MKSTGRYGNSILKENETEYFRSKDSNLMVYLVWCPSLFLHGNDLCTIYGSIHKSSYCKPTFHED